LAVLAAQRALQLTEELKLKPQEGLECQPLSFQSTVAQSVILATWEAEIRRIAVQGHSKQNIQETPSQPIPGHSSLLSILTKQRSTKRRILV
jgi:hypothetical protein